LVERAHASGWRVVLNAAPPQVLPSNLLARGDVLVVNELEAATVFGLPASTPETLAARAADWECDVVVTLGRNGMVVRAGDTAPTLLPAFSVEPVDTVGAGDAFVGTMAVALAEAQPLLAAVRLGAAAGAATATVRSPRHQTMTADTVAAMVGTNR
jgi:ribokinase